MQTLVRHIVVVLLLITSMGQSINARDVRVQYLNDTIHLIIPDKFMIEFNQAPSQESLDEFYSKVDESDYQPLVKELLKYKEQNQLNDWLFYQLIRKTAQSFSPKVENYHRYTLYKWFLLAKCGYDATLSYGASTLLFYVRSEDNIYGIPFFNRDGNQYICLNYHDYGKIDFNKELVKETTLRVPEGNKAFSYKITLLPEFKPADYLVKDLQFNYQNKDYHFKVKLNPEIKTLFNNYPVSDFSNYFNIPLSKETHSSLIPELKNAVSGLNQLDGVDFLMRFTRYAFLYENDQVHFGKEKRLSPEQTLLYEYSDCDDRAALFFYLVKELYDLPMIAMLYPTHITIAVHFDNQVGKTIEYKGRRYSVCDPTPQSKDMRIGQVAAQYKHTPYEVVYAYEPASRR